jgi:integrase
MPYRDRGKWRGVVTVKGKRFSASFGTKREATVWENRSREKLSSSQKSMDFISFSSKYLELAASRFVNNTNREKATLNRDFLQFIGSNLQVEEITARHVQDYLLEQAKNRGTNAANKDRKNLLAMWNWGQKILDLPVNPVTKTYKLPYDKKPQYTPPEKDVLCLLAAANRKERAFLDCYLCTGARRSEILRLKWEDVNFEKREIRLWTRKTKDGSMEGEWLPMTGKLQESLRWCWQNRLFKESPFVWVNEEGPNTGNPFVTRHRFMKGLCKRAQIRQFGFHALRRYVASILADTHKISAKTIQRILRHKSLQTTERYIQNINRDLSGVMSLLDVNLDESTTTDTTDEKKESG